jgi:hypothetical protein
MGQFLVTALFRDFAQRLCGRYRESVRACVRLNALAGASRRSNRLNYLRTNWVMKPLTMLRNPNRKGLCSNLMFGEIGGAAFDLLPLLNTGRGRTLSTVHAKSAAQATSRLTTRVLPSGVEIPYHAIKTNVADSLNVLVKIEGRP